MHSVTATHLSLPLRLPDEDLPRYQRLAVLTQRVATHVLSEHWTPAHLDGISDNSHRAWKYFDESAPFEQLGLYLPSRYRRCILQKVGETLRSHAERRTAFQSIQRILPPHKIRRIHRRRIKEELWDDGESLSSGYLDTLITHLNRYFDRHGEYPTSYFDIQECPEYDSGALPYSADDGPMSGQAVRYAYDVETTTLTVELKTPDTLTPGTRGDWSWSEYHLNGYDAFHDLLNHGDLSAPGFNPAQRKTGDLYYELVFPVEVTRLEKPDEVDRILAVDAGIRKDATAVVVNSTGEQLSKPYFIRFTDRSKMRRLHRERTLLNNRLAALRRQGRAHTDDFAHVHSEYERVNSKIQHKRKQLTHDIANQIVALGLVYDVDAIVHENLRSLTPPVGEGELSWELSSWARRDITDNIEYRAECVGLHVKRVFPAYTSRTCPRCGSTGHTTKSPAHDAEVWWGGHFRCDNARCGFEGDRDYAGALNVARVYFSDTDGLDHEFTTSYIGDSELVLAGRSAGTRLIFGTGVVSYTPAEQTEVTAGGGSAVIAPAVTLSEPTTDGSVGCGPASRQWSCFHRTTANSY